MPKPLLMLAFLSVLAPQILAEEAAAPKSLAPLTVEQVLQTSAAEELFTMALERGARLADLLERVTDEKSALRVNFDAQRCYVELQMIDIRVGMIPPGTRETYERLTPIVNQLRDMRVRLLKQCERLDRSPRLAQLMDPVVRPLYRDSKNRVEAFGRFLVNQLQIIRSQTELYKLQHNDKLPDFRKQGWTQLTNKTRPDGQKADDAAYGPYLQSAPINPLLNRSRILVARSAPKKDFHYTGGDCGFVIDESTGKIWAIDLEGKIFNEAQTAQADLR